MFSIANLILPVDHQLKTSIIELSRNSQNLINIVAATTIKKLLNIRVNYEKYVIGDICFAHDLILQKNPHSLRDTIC